MRLQERWSMDIATGRFAWPLAVYGSSLVLLVLSIVVDPLPRFFQGDSLSYLMTGIGWVPPDRSWAFGYLVHWLLAGTGGFVAFVVLSNAVLWAVVVCSRQWFEGALRRNALCYAALALLAVCDPLLGIYTRFIMSDFLAFACFFGFLDAFRRGLRPGSRLAPALLGMAVFTLAAIYLRIAYALVIEGAAAIALVVSLRSASIGQRWRIGIVLLLPVLSVGVLGVSNTVVFGDTFHHRFFINKLSGSLLMGVFAPALDRSDFTAAGVTLSEAEFAGLHLGDYGARGNVTFGADEHGARFLVKERLGITDNYDDALDRTFGRVVRHAALRDPAAMAGVYLRTLLIYFEPAEWRRSFVFDMGIERPLDPVFVRIIDKFTTEKLDPTITGRRSAMLRAYDTVLTVYPFILLAVSALALVILTRRRASLAEIVASAGLLASLLAAPLYSDYAIPRYVLASVFLGYLLVTVSIAGSGRRSISGPA